MGDGMTVLVACTEVDRANGLAASFPPLAGVTSTAIEVAQTLRQDGKLVVLLTDGNVVAVTGSVIREFVVGDDHSGLREEIQRTLDVAGLPTGTSIVIYSEKPVDTSGLPATVSDSAVVGGVDVPAGQIEAYCVALRGLGAREDGLNLLRTRRSRGREFVKAIAFSLVVFLLCASAFLLLAGLRLDAEARSHEQATARLDAAEQDAWSKLFPERPYARGELRQEVEERVQQYVPDPEVKSALLAFADIAGHLPDANRTGFVLSKLLISQEGFLLTGQVPRGKAIPTENVDLIEAGLSNSGIFRTKVEEVRVKDGVVELRLKGIYR
jgi:hypothetical protein